MNLMNAKLQPYQWQEEAFKKWQEASCLGTVKAATGAGKTMLGLMAIETFDEQRVIVLVHTIHLQSQWRDALVKNLGLSREDIGLIGGMQKNIVRELEKKYIIAIVNSVRGVFMSCGTLIVDEVHRFGSVENIKVIQNASYVRLLCFSATPEREDKRHEFIFAKAPLVYSYSQREGLKDGLLCEFDIVNVSVELTQQEAAQYSMINDFIAREFPRFNNDYSRVRASVNQRSFESQIAADLLRAFNKRRAIVNSAKNKVTKCTEIVKNAQGKVIVFGELINLADEIVNDLSRGDVKNVLKYNSQMKLKERRLMLEEFKSCDSAVMVAVKALDEGINVPDCNNAIIVSGSSVDRQMIQRTGRMLRAREGKIATLYQIYARGTVDERWLRDRSREVTGNAKSVVWK